MLSALSRGQASYVPPVKHVRFKAVIKKKVARVGTKMGKKWGNQEGKGPNKVQSAGKRVAFRPMAPAQLESNPLFAHRTESISVPDFQPAALTSENTGKAMGLLSYQTDPVWKFGAPRNIIYDLRLLTKPASVIRDVTVKTVDTLNEAGKTSSKDSRYVIYGQAGSGKSYTLLQAVQYAKAAKWLVMYIPRAVSLVNSTTNFSYDMRTQTYVQPVFARSTLSRFLTVNEALLSNLKLESPIEVDQNTIVPAGASYADLVRVGTDNVALAPNALSGLLESLGNQTKYPFLLAVDDFQALFSKSAYKSPHFETVKSWHLSMPRLLLDYFSGKKTFARGAVVGALSSTNRAYSLSPELRQALNVQPELGASPFTKVAPELTAYTQGIKTIEIPSRLQVEEAASLFDIWTKNTTLHTRANDEFFMSKYAESCGNARDFVWKGILATLRT
ncbi:hypothetical protein PENSPDRAFT_750913 [Peniophora sp. CONT]|nr:hypothetical protein PENSPDRAFT_750913 [Peniophora sp. CONT]